MSSRAPPRDHAWVFQRLAGEVNADEAPLGTGIGCLVHADRDAIDLRRCRAALRHIHIEDSECAGWVVSGVGYNNTRSEEHTSELQSLRHLVCRLLLEKKK